MAARIPLTAREQLFIAREHGHQLSIFERVNKDHLDAPPKWWVHCTCGWQSTARRSKSAVNGAMAWHLGKIIADHLESGERNGRKGAASAARPPVRRIS